MHSCACDRPTSRACRPRTESEVRLDIHSARADSIAYSAGHPCCWRSYAPDWSVLPATLPMRLDESCAAAYAPVMTSLRRPSMLVGRQGLDVGHCLPAISLPLQSWQRCPAMLALSNGL